MMSAHEDCAAPGKFSCTADEYIQDLALDMGDGEGDVESPVAWFSEVTLDESDERERGAAEHYGSRWLIAREFSDGRFAVEAYPTEGDRHDRLESLRAAYVEWDVRVLTW